jgi:hypothetical protein
LEEKVSRKEADVDVCRFSGVRVEGDDYRVTG